MDLLAHATFSDTATTKARQAQKKTSAALHNWKQHDDGWKESLNNEREDKRLAG